MGTEGRGLKRGVNPRQGRRTDVREKVSWPGLAFSPSANPGVGGGLPHMEA